MQLICLEIVILIFHNLNKMLGVPQTFYSLKEGNIYFNFDTDII